MLVKDRVFERAESSGILETEHRPPATAMDRRSCGPEEAANLPKTERASMLKCELNFKKESKCCTGSVSLMGRYFSLEVREKAESSTEKKSEVYYNYSDIRGSVTVTWIKMKRRTKYLGKTEA